MLEIPRRDWQYPLFMSYKALRLWYVCLMLVWSSVLALHTLGRGLFWSRGISQNHVPLPFYEVKSSIFGFYLSDFGSTYHSDRWFILLKMCHICISYVPGSVLVYFYENQKINTKGPVHKLRN